MNKKILKTSTVLLVGILIGVLITGAASAVVGQQVTAYLDNNISILFNGEEKELPEDMDVIIYNNRTYTPARFIAEELNADVGWDPVTRSVLINWVEPEPEVIVEECECPPCEVCEEREDRLDIYYREVPLTIFTEELVAAVTVIDTYRNETTFYLELEGRRDDPVQLEQRSAVLTIDGETYKHTDVRGVVGLIDQNWYQDIKKDDRVGGYIKFNALDEDVEYVTLEVDYVINISGQPRKTLRFDIKL